MPTIYQGYAAILKYGTPKQKEIIRDMQGSLIHIIITPIGGGASGDCAVEFPVNTQRLIDTAPMSLARAYSELRLRIDPATAQTNAGLEGTLVHESRHAYHMARAISDFSYGKKNPYNPNGFEIEYAANAAYVEYVAQCVRLNHPDKNILVNEAVNLIKIAKQIGNRIVVYEAGIRKRLWTQYGSNDTTHKGQTFGDFWKLKPALRLVK